ncbi:pilus assembly PilX family protein [Paralysiella testudinis]|uniref:Pilus assembly protein PilX n=1 Tax=Paralysiella testudinis TaxID=2809020 RepID=A0A892ZDJ0_9NEIS|nr:PilX N-terminal domain-containing pilus assembly protein [Paralysiella testudinis]QRQ80700.1 pilus assembly protein PilX [Paralysiella testudinis]
MHYPIAQRGFSLFIVLIVMLVIAFMVVAGVQSMNTEMRISSNDADRKLAMSVAETALRAGEKSIATYNNATRFDVNCTGGRCIPAGGVAPAPSGVNVPTELFGITQAQRLGSCTGCGTAAWERANIFERNGNAVEVSVVGDYARRPRYIVEYLNMNSAGQYYFRVTARAWGKNPNTVVTIQSYVEAVY